MTPDVIYSIFGLFEAIAVISLVLFIAGGLAYAIARVFTDSNS